MTFSLYPFGCPSSHLPLNLGYHLFDNAVPIAVFYDPLLDFSRSHCGQRHKWEFSKELTKFLEFPCTFSLAISHGLLSLILHQPLY